MSDNVGRVAMFFSQFNGVHLTEETKKTKTPKSGNSWTKTKPGVVATWRGLFRSNHVDAANTCGQSSWRSCFSRKHAWVREHSSSSRKGKQPFFLHNLIAVVPYLVLVANGHITSLFEEEEREETWGMVFFGPTATFSRPRRRNRGRHFNVHCLSLVLIDSFKHSSILSHVSYFRMYHPCLVSFCCWKVRGGSFVHTC